MARHDLYVNTPGQSTGKQLHVPGYIGTSTQRVAETTMTQSDQWFETDTGLTYQYSGSVWTLLGSGGVVGSGSVVSGPVFITSTVQLNQRLTII